MLNVELGGMGNFPFSPGEAGERCLKGSAPSLKDLYGRRPDSRGLMSDKTSTRGLKKAIKKINVSERHLVT